MSTVGRRGWYASLNQRYFEPTCNYLNKTRCRTVGELGTCGAGPKNSQKTFRSSQLCSSFAPNADGHYSSHVVVEKPEVKSVVLQIPVPEHAMQVRAPRLRPAASPAVSHVSMCEVAPRGGAHQVLIYASRVARRGTFSASSATQAKSSTRG